ncbi:VRR-NUC domain-containing protein [Clostridium sp. D2Q-11]|uniref:VRR-NUC domain-containing protein n=1 Tax=Anaeromonas frigoriresistens TaxID=2683708 RepID=A0A942UVD5_9FIRM|nr:VRR-NUC domain-containing protein [Anaeromonas frigoriresistens]MBS4538195.1 VRR-NUC domain-containing protein [Anaeromonas frigoriresistens]
MREKDIQNEIRLALRDIAVVFRINVGTFMSDTGKMVSTGVPKGFSDLFGVRKLDGKAFFIEVKNEKGRTSKYQDNFLKKMKESGAIVGVARSGSEAIKIIKEEI